MQMMIRSSLINLIKQAGRGREYQLSLKSHHLPGEQGSNPWILSKMRVMVILSMKMSSQRNQIYRGRNQVKMTGRG